LQNAPIPRQIVESVECDSTSPERVAREFRSLLEAGARFHVSGRARRRPEQLLRLGYTPKHKLELFGTRFYLSNVRQNPELRFYVAYVVQPRARGAGEDVFARIFYKDLSLVWRVASHLSYDVDGSLWIGKGDVRPYREKGEEMVASVESTTDLPLEMQTALESRLRAIRRVPGDGRVLELVLRRAALVSVCSPSMPDFISWKSPCKGLSNARPVTTPPTTTPIRMNENRAVRAIILR
jgi:hypothetical protein